MTGPLGNAFGEPARGQPAAAAGGDPGRRRHRRRAAGPAAPPLLRARRPARGSCSASATSSTRGGLDLFCSAAGASAPRCGWPARTATPATAATSPTCWRRCWPATTPARRVVYACGPPPMLEAVRALCAEAVVPCELALESPMACGYGACFGCAVPKPGGGYLRLCVDGPVLAGEQLAAVPKRSWPVPELCGIELAHPVLNGSGTYDAIAARQRLRRRAPRRLPLRRLRLEDDHPAAARRQRAAADLGDAGGDDQLDRAPQQGPGWIPRRGPAGSWPSCRCR